MNFDLQYTKRLAAMCDAVYTDSTDMPAYKGYAVRVYTDVRHDCRMAVLTSEVERIVCIRGTANFKNVVTDIDFFKKEDPTLKIHIHKGFDTAAKSLYSMLPVSNLPTMFTGHSLGGALAVVMAMWYSLDKSRLIPCVTFGQPKVTDWGGVKAMQSKIMLTRVVHGNDPVPLVAPREFVTLFRPYRHFGQEAKLYDDKEHIFFSYGQETTTSCSVELMKRLLSDKLKLKDAEDHCITKYIANLEKVKVL